MRVCLLWFDNDPRRPLEEKVKQAVRRYKEKFGVSPNVCYVNPEVLSGVDGAVKAPVALKPSRRVMPNHFLVGVVEKTRTQ